MKRAARLYLLTVSVVGLGIFFILHLGSQLPPPASPLLTQSTAKVTQQVTYTSDSSLLGSVKSGLWQNASNPLSRLFLQLMVIITASFLIGRLFTRCGHT